MGRILHGWQKQTFGLSDFRTLGLPDSRTPGLSDSRTLKSAGADPVAGSAPEGGNPVSCYPPAGDSRSTLADGALNFRVRNGNGCDNPSMGTGKRRGRTYQTDAATRAGRVRPAESGERRKKTSRTEN